MKIGSIAVLLASLVVFCNCEKKKIKLEKVDVNVASNDVMQFYNDYPDSISVDTGKIAYGNYHVVYAVLFLRDSAHSNELEEFFPDLDFGALKYPANTNGVRIYHAISTTKHRKDDEKHPKFLNYLVFTTPPVGSDILVNDTLGDVYLIENHLLDLRFFREERISSYQNLQDGGITHHLSCAPQCPRISLIRR